MYQVKTRLFPSRALAEKFVQRRIWVRDAIITGGYLPGEKALLTYLEN